MFHFASKTIAILTLTMTTFTVGCTKSPKSDDSSKTPSVKTGAEKTAATDVKAEPIALKDFPIPGEAKVIDTTAETRTIMMRGPNTLDVYSKFFETKLGELG